MPRILCAWAKAGRSSAASASVSASRAQCLAPRRGPPPPVRGQAEVGQRSSAGISLLPGVERGERRLVVTFGQLPVPQPVTNTAQLVFQARQICAARQRRRRLVAGGGPFV